MEDSNEVAAGTSAPLTGGENIVGGQDFASITEQGALAALQADIAERGGFTERLSVAWAGALVPCFLRAGLRPAASPILLNVAMDDRLLEVDVSRHPGRNAFGPMIERLGKGAWQIASGAQLGTGLPQNFGEAVALHREVQRSSAGPARVCHAWRNRSQFPFAARSLTDRRSHDAQAGPASPIALISASSSGATASPSASHPFRSTCRRSPGSRAPS